MKARENKELHSFFPEFEILDMGDVSFTQHIKGKGAPGQTSESFSAPVTGEATKSVLASSPPAAEAEAPATTEGDAAAPLAPVTQTAAAPEAVLPVIEPTTGEVVAAAPAPAPAAAAGE